jgi:hypothetical protein
VKTKVIAMDFSNGAEIYDGLDEKLGSLDIGILSKLNYNNYINTNHVDSHSLFLSFVY